MSATALRIASVQLEENRIKEIMERAKQWALLNGVQMRPQSNAASTSEAEYAPMTLFPSAMPMDMISEAKSLQKHFNTLMFKVGHDYKFLEQALHNVVKVDEFTGKLWKIYQAVIQAGSAQSVSLGLFRNDFMLDVKNSCCDINGLPVGVKLKQIEFNTIASSFAGLSSGIWNVHRYTMAQAGMDFKPEQIPENVPSRGLATGLLKAWEYYNSPSAAVVFIVQKNERNTMDQRWIEAQLFTLNKNVPVKYITLQEASENYTLLEDKRLLLNDIEVAVIYFRDGYSPDHYQSEKDWSIRELMELSRAVKCPSVHVQLAGCKKIQQELAIPGTVERFISNKNVCERIRSTFAGQYSLDLGPKGDENVKMALSNPKHYVVKPQREGGGNNVYGEDITPFLNKIMDSEERNAYILMGRVFPWPQKNYLLKEGKEAILRDVISELGIYGVYLGGEDEELYNEEGGHLLRTKSNEDNEGGIMAGFATIDSPLLLEPAKCDMEPVKCD